MHLSMGALDMNQLVHEDKKQLHCARNGITGVSTRHINPLSSRELLSGSGVGVA